MPRPRPTPPPPPPFTRRRRRRRRRGPRPKPPPPPPTPPTPAPLLVLLLPPLQIRRRGTKTRDIGATAAAVADRRGRRHTYTTAAHFLLYRRRSRVTRRARVRAASDETHGVQRIPLLYYCCTRRDGEKRCGSADVTAIGLDIKRRTRALASARLSSFLNFFHRSLRIVFRSREVWREGWREVGRTWITQTLSSAYIVKSRS